MLMLARVLAAMATSAAALAFAAQVAAPPVVRDAPARDAAPAKNTAAISGRVTNLDTERPLRRARILITSPALPSPRSASTNSDGRYEIRDLPPGRYTVRAERGGYLPLAYGQRRPGEPGKPLDLANAQAAGAIDFALPRVGVISGRVVDELGEPIAHVNIWAMELRYYQGARRLVTTPGHESTDDSGQYRLTGLPPGEFVVMAQIRETWPLESDPKQTFSYAPSYYPGVIAPAEARRIKLGIGQEVGNIDFALVPSRAATLSGTVFNAAGMPVAGESVNLSQEISGPTMMSVFPSSNSGRTGPDGTFTIAGVQPGEYRLNVQVPALGDQPAQEAQDVLQATGADMHGLTIVTGAGGTLRGQVSTDDGSPLPPNVDRLRVLPQVLTPGQRLARNWSARNGHVDKTGAFELKSLFGPVVLSMAALTDDWTLKRIEVEGRDIADDPIEIAHGQTVSGVRVVLTSRPTYVRGGLTDEKRRPVEGTVIIFAEQRSRWRENSRMVRAARPDQNGEFSFKGLPAGNYLITALDYVEEGQWHDPDFLDSVKNRAERISLADAENKRVDLILRK